MEGYLRWTNKFMVMRVWVVVDQQQLTYYEIFDVREQKPKKIKGLLYLQNANIIKISDQNIAHGLKIKTEKGKATFICADVNSWNTWYNVLTRAVSLHEEEKERKQKPVTCRELLEIPESKYGPKLTKSMITRAYKKLSLKEHPDKGGNAEKFHQINTAYKFLLQYQQDQESLENSEILRYEVIIEKMPGIGLGLSVTEDKNRGLIFVSGINPETNIIGITEEAEGEIHLNDILVGIDDDDTSKWVLSRIRSRLDSFRVPVGNRVRFTFERRIPLSDNEDDNNTNDLSESYYSSSRANSPMPVPPPHPLKRSGPPKEEGNGGEESGGNDANSHTSSRVFFAGDSMYFNNKNNKNNNDKERTDENNSEKQQKNDNKNSHPTIIIPPAPILAEDSQNKNNNNKDNSGSKRRKSEKQNQDDEDDDVNDESSTESYNYGLGRQQRSLSKQSIDYVPNVTNPVNNNDEKQKADNPVIIISPVSALEEDFSRRESLRQDKKGKITMKELQEQLDQIGYKEEEEKGDNNKPIPSLQQQQRHLITGQQDDEQQDFIDPIEHQQKLIQKELNFRNQFNENQNNQLTEEQRKLEQYEREISLLQVEMENLQKKEKSLQQSNELLNDQISFITNEKYDFLEYQFEQEKQQYEKELYMQQLLAEIDSLKQIIQKDLPHQIATQNKSFLLNHYQSLQQQITHYLHYEKPQLERNLQHYRHLLNGNTRHQYNSQDSSDERLDFIHSSIAMSPFEHVNILQNMENIFQQREKKAQNVEDKLRALLAM